MNNINTKLGKGLLKGDDITKIFKEEVEKGMNSVLESELTGFLNYEKHSVKGYNTGNSRNGSYRKTLYSEYGKLSIKVPTKRQKFRIRITTSTIQKKQYYYIKKE